MRTQTGRWAQRVHYSGAMREATPAAPIETGILPSGHPYARIGVGERVVLSIPALAIIEFSTKPATVARQWKAWLGPIERHGLSFVSIARRPDLPPGSSAADVAADYASVIAERWGRAVAVMGISTGGTYATWLAANHPEVVDRLVLAFTAHRVPADVLAVQRQAIDHALAGRWRSAYAQLGAWFVPQHARIASIVLWLLGPHLGGRSKDTRALAIDAYADETHDATGRLTDITCPTLVVSGGRDVAYPPDLIRELVAGLPDVRHIDYPESGHGGPGARFAEDACAFLAGGPSPDGLGSLT